ncbi:LuxR C-terminal-related transcriptional regulator [Streptomyces lasiicapitis]|uniref:helix-turn-helix transcriptional regulator n=1 Tax=Streptomyces lasiicapitis TaxID=1923961 RepID=UPI0033310BE4
MVTEHRAHEVGELCEAGGEAYSRALREGRVHASDAARAPCLTELGLLFPDPRDDSCLRPTPPAVALPRLLRTLDERVIEERRREERLVEKFEPLMSLGGRADSSDGTPAFTVLEGLRQINLTITQATDTASQEILTIQPGGARPAEALAIAFPRDQAFLARGCRMRTLYQHTTRHALPVLAHYERLVGDVEVRTLDEVTERLVVVDRSVAFIPANERRTLALEVRHPAIITNLVTTFELLWRLATPMLPKADSPPSRNGITPRQQAIAALLTEGLTDTEIAARLGMNVRTARVHIAKLSAVLKSTSRAQLGYLIGKSGILDHTH